MDHKLICDILNSEMVVATGCTEPAAIALTAATARTHLQGKVSKVKVSASVNMIKNAMSAGIPGTEYTGMDYAAALGATGGDISRGLQVVDHASAEAIEEAAALVHSGNVEMSKSENPEKLYIDVTLESETGHTARAIIASAHTNVIYEEADGKVISQHDVGTLVEGVPAEKIIETLSIETIYNFVNELDREKDDLHMIENAIAINSKISEVGLEGTYGLNIGKNIAKAREKGYIGDDLVTRAMEATSAGADARMAGANVPVVTNSGSGNQGITATVSVLSAAKSLGADEDKTFRAVTLSNLIGIHIHARFGLLSALCGATVAGTGAACGIVYLLGGGVKEMEYAVNNMMGDVTGMMCDGAKADCALKISTCINAACHCAFMAMDHVYVKNTDGIVETDAEKTIVNFTELGNKGSQVMDNLILDIMLNKEGRY